MSNGRRRQVHEQHKGLRQKGVAKLKRVAFMLLDARPPLWGPGGAEPKTYVTCDSRVVPHRSTVQAHSCLTSEFGWDPVLSARYERTMNANFTHLHHVGVGVYTSAINMI